MSSPSDAESTRARRAYRCPGAWVVLLTVLCLGLTADLWSKHWAFSTVAGGMSRAEMEEHNDQVPPQREYRQTALPWGLLDFSLVKNFGAVFGIGPNQRWFFVVFTAFALAAGLFVFGRFTNGRQRLAHVAIGLILAGGGGNLYDRFVFHYVRDFLHMLPDVPLPFGWHWPGGGDGSSSGLFPWVFNVADMMLLTGMGLLMLHINRVERRRKRAEAEKRAGRGEGREAEAGDGRAPVEAA
ncbi:MAG: signal peptidase II [Phycisphaerales bacterium]|nr:MAG: signal peptidase II [Phycisphaerales bacterium]